MSIQATPDRHRLLSLHSCGAHAVHHPAAFTCLPGNSWHGPCAEPAAPWYRPQLAQLLPGVAPLACRASATYFTAWASGAPTASRVESAAKPEPALPPPTGATATSRA